MGCWVSTVVRNTEGSGQARLSVDTCSWSLGVGLTRKGQFSQLSAWRDSPVHHPHSKQPTELVSEQDWTHDGWRRKLLRKCFSSKFRRGPGWGRLPSSSLLPSSFHSCLYTRSTHTHTQTHTATLPECARLKK